MIKFLDLIIKHPIVVIKKNDFEVFFNLISKTQYYDQQNNTILTPQTCDYGFIVN